MAKHYDLVGSVYDKYARGNKYREEEIIKSIDNSYIRSRSAFIIGNSFIKFS